MGELLPPVPAQKAFLQDYFLPLGLGQAHSDHPHGSEAASGLDYSGPGDAASSCLRPVALNSTGHLGPNRAVVGKDSAGDRAARGCPAARAVLKDVSARTKLPFAQLPTHLFLSAH